MDSARDTLAGGLPHSEIPGSTIARISPGLIAACHALHRLSVPRHPPDALTTLLPGYGISRIRQNPPLTGTKTATRITDPREQRLSSVRDAYSREDTLPQRRTNIPSGAVSYQLSALSERDTRLGHTLFTLSKNAPAMQAHCRQTVLPRSPR